MTEPENSKSNTHPESEDETRTFDMYHFFSRKDMILAAIVIVLLVVAGLYFFLSGPKVV